MNHDLPTVERVAPATVHKGDWILDNCGFPVEVLSRRHNREMLSTRFRYVAYDGHGQPRFRHHLDLWDFETVERVVQP